MKKLTLIVLLFILTSGLMGCHGFWRHDGDHHHDRDHHWSGYGGGREGGHGEWRR